MPKIVTTEQMRAIEQAADAGGHSYDAMMQRAGYAVARRVITLLAGIAEPRVAILVGPGNNGGDGLVAGRILVEQLPDVQVGLFMLKPRDPDADLVFAAAQQAGLFIAHAADDQEMDYRILQDMVANADVVIDALFGTSLRLPIRGTAAEVLKNARHALDQRHNHHTRNHPAPYSTPTQPRTHLLNQSTQDRAPIVVAVDSPSGLDCDTGEIDPLALPADETITFAAAKPGQFIFPGAEAVGTLHIADIGLPPHLEALDQIDTTLVDAASVTPYLPDRSPNSHKGTYGKAMIVAGSLNYQGAAFLSASAAYRCGAGLVTVATPQIIVPTLAGMLPEATWLLLPHTLGVLNENAVKVLRDELATYTALLIGPGLGHEDDTRAFLQTLLRTEDDPAADRNMGFLHQPDQNTAPAHQNAVALPPLVIDADGLNILADIPSWPDLLPPGTIITPHPGEFARLTGLPTAEIQADRVNLAQQAAAEWNCVVVLKGAYTVIAAPDGQTALLPFASAALAKAGTGDVLAGAITGLRAEGLDPFHAAIAGGWLHGLAGLHAAEIYRTTASVLASDVLELLTGAYAATERTRR